MRTNYSKWAMIAALYFLLFAPEFGSAQKAKTENLTLQTVQTAETSALRVEVKNIRAHLEFLASDALQGRGSGTQFELIAAQYLAAGMRQYGIEPAVDSGVAGEKSYIQTVEIIENSFAEPPTLSFSGGEGAVSFAHGQEMLIFRISTGKISGGLKNLRAGETPEKGTVAFIPAGQEGLSRADLSRLMESGAAAVIFEETPQWRAGWQRMAARTVSFTTLSGRTGNSTSAAAALIIVSQDAAKILSATADDTRIEIGGKLDTPRTRKTWNAVGMIRGSDEARPAAEVIVLSAHLDHLGVRPEAVGTDKIFNGADDDASGCVAVLELARVLAGGKRPRRTVYFAFFGSEEAGGFGSRYFAANLPFPKENFIANLQFEMLGRPDPKVGRDTLWLTGFELSDLGTELAKHGARLVQDPHPEQNFFRRSDNYTLARQGIIAHTISSYGLHTDYHQVSDEIATIDFEYMAGAINSLVGPVHWLVNTDFKPGWYEGKQP